MEQQDAAGVDQGAAWMRYSHPGPEHARLAAFAGIWEQENRIWTHAGAEPLVFRAVSEMRTIHGGRYLAQSMKGGMEMQGQIAEFDGTGYFGFDNFKQKHFFAWIDNSATNLMQGKGAADGSGRITYTGSIPDPLTGGPADFKAVLWKEGEHRFVFENFGKQPDGTWFLKMQVVSTRRQAPAPPS